MNTLLRDSKAVKTQAEAVASGVVEKKKIIQTLVNLRKGFEFLASGVPIESVKVSLGFTINDICTGLDFTEAEKEKVLGKKAAARIKEA